MANGLAHTVITAEPEFSINFTKAKDIFYLNLRYNRSNSFLYVNGIKINQFKAKYSEITVYPLCLGSISKDFTNDNMKETRLNGYVYDFTVNLRVLVLMIF